MKTIILAGGFGTRFSELTESMPKPMIKVGSKPIIWHVMSIYASYGFNDFVIALGYKGELIKEFFLNYKKYNSDFSINLKSGETNFLDKPDVDWNLSLIDTGLNTLTGGRLKLLKEIVGNNTFMLTYADGVANIDINKLLDFHKSHGKMVTLTAVRPNARFGELEIRDDQVIKFEEKPQLQDGWINGGFFVIEPEFFELLGEKDTMLERKPLENAVKKGQLMTYKHNGFWQCMDSKRDHEVLQSLYREDNKSPWALTS